MTSFLVVDGKRFRLGDLVGGGSSWTVQVDSEKVKIEILSENGTSPRIFLMRAGTKVARVAIAKRGDASDYSIQLNGRPIVAGLEEDSPVLSSAGHRIVHGPVLVESPMAGKIASVKIAEGDEVAEGQALIVLESMKMENEIAAPKKGTVKEVYVQPGALAKPGDKLVLVE